MKILLLTLSIFIISGCTFLNKQETKFLTKKLNKSEITNTTSRKKVKLSKNITLKEIIKWDSSRYCSSYMLTGKLIANYYDSKKIKKEKFSGYIYINYTPKTFKISIYDKYNQKIFDKTINSSSFALCIGKGMCVNVSSNDLIGYLKIQQLENPKLIKDTLIGFKDNRIVVVNYPKEAQIRDLGKIIKYSYDEKGKIRKIDIKIKRIGNIKILVNKISCKKKQ
ncbi:MAG TPA: hypothetical protein EYP03_03105 [Aquificae bacterium]|nr:hypothetical protein [Aquificota bacterium]